MDPGVLSAEEEALKKNTDCIYFLASPLSCKKGSECEYRHSEVARLNPRDCHYWLSSSCLNPKCAFRHPPLDGLLGHSGSASGPALLPTRTVASKQIPTAQAQANNLNKQSVPCIYFQKGQCLKGAWCSFSHATLSNSGGDAPHPVVKAFPSLPDQQNAFKNESRGIKQCANHQNITKVKADIISSVAPKLSANLVVRATSQSSNSFSHAKNPLPCSLGSELYTSQPAKASVVNSDAQNRQIHPSNEQPRSEVEPGEIIDEHYNYSEVESHVGNNVRGGGYLPNGDGLERKPNVRGGGYLPNGDGLERKPSHPERRQDTSADYEHRPYVHKSVPVYERNRYDGSRAELNRNGRVQDYNDMRSHRISSKRTSERSSLPESSEIRRQKSPDKVRSDLRRQLKQRKLSGAATAFSSDHDRPMENKYHGHHSRSDQRQLPHDSSIRNRLQGRIALPGSSSSGAAFNAGSANERGASRSQGRLSPTRPISGNQGARNLGGRLGKREGADSLDFTGPKSLAELKGKKLVESTQEPSTKTSSNMISCMQNNVASYQERGSSRFEGPKPLSVLLKRKRVEDSDGRKNDERIGGAELPGEVQPSSELSNKEDNKVQRVEEKDSIPSRDDELIYDGQASAKEGVLGDEDYMEVDAIMEEDQEIPNFDEKDGDVSDYDEAIDTGVGKTEYDESQGEEDDDLDDEEDFARKVGLIFS